MVLTKIQPQDLKNNIAKGFRHGHFLNLNSSMTRGDVTHFVISLRSSNSVSMGRGPEQRHNRHVCGSGISLISGGKYVKSPKSLTSNLKLNDFSPFRGFSGKKFPTHYHVCINSILILQELVKDPLPL